LQGAGGDFDDGVLGDEAQRSWHTLLSVRGQQSCLLPAQISGTAPRAPPPREAKYSYCVSGNKMAWTPQGTSPTTTGTIAFQK